jgi:hypothetical protein
MRFLMPNNPYEFELPGKWWTQAGMDGFFPQSDSYAYPAAPNVIIVPLGDVQPLRRKAENDWRGFGRERMLWILQRMASREDLPPIEVVDIPCERHLYPPYRYGLYDGFHRFHASIAAGFTSIPAIIRPGSWSHPDDFRAA